jgi:hypothetical protein
MQPIVLIKIFIALFSLGWSSFCLSEENWYPFTSSQSNLSLAIDKNSVTVEGNKVRFWERVEFARPEQVDEVSGRLIKFKKIQRVMHCVERTQGVIRGSLFGENNKLIEAIIVDADKVEMSPIAAGTVAEQELSVVCAQVQKTNSGVGHIPPLAPTLPSSVTDTSSTLDIRNNNAQRSP